MILSTRSMQREMRVQFMQLRRLPSRCPIFFAGRRGIIEGIDLFFANAVGL